MPLKLLSAVAAVALIAAALLSLEQRRLLAAHAMSDLHVQMDADRKATWDARAHIAETADPRALRAAVDRAARRSDGSPA